MKRAISLILAIMLCLCLCACGDDTSETTASANPPTAREELTDLEESLFSNLISITKDSFYEPAAVRVLEVYDYEERSKYENTNSHDILFGPDTVVVRLQGENKVGGTLNHYYLICIKSGENQSYYAQAMIKAFSGYYGNKEARMRYKADAGEYVEIGDSYEAEKDASDQFNIGRINKAIKEYWEEMGF